MGLSVGVTLVLSCGSVFQLISMCTRTHTHSHTQMYEYIDSLSYRHSSSCLSLEKHTTQALLLTRPSYHVREGCVL